MVGSNQVTQLPAGVGAGLLPRGGTYLTYVVSCLWSSLVAWLLPILLVTPLLGSSLLHPDGAPGGHLLDLLDPPPGGQRNGLRCGVVSVAIGLPPLGPGSAILGLC